MRAREPQMVRIGGQEQEQTEKTEELQIRGSVLPGRVYVLEGTPDLQNWTPLQTNTIRTSAAILEFVEPVLTSPPQRLYRLAERP